jgi:hypothetical protein
MSTRSKRNASSSKSKKLNSKRGRVNPLLSISEDNEGLIENAEPVLKAVKETIYTGPDPNLNNAPYIQTHDFREPPPPELVKGRGSSKTVWHIPGSEGTGTRVIVNATEEQHQIREKARDDYNYTKLLHDTYGCFSEVTEIPHLVGKKFEKFVYFAEIAQRVTFRTALEGDFYLRHAFRLFNALYSAPGEHFMVLIDIKPDNFGIVDHGNGPTLICIDIDTKDIIAVRKSLEAKTKFFMKYQQLLLLMTFFLFTNCPQKAQLFKTFADFYGLTKYDFYRVYNYVFSKEDVTELTTYHQRFLHSHGLSHSAKDIERSVRVGYYRPPPFHLRYYLRDNYQVIVDLLSGESIAANYDHPNFLF